MIKKAIKNEKLRRLAINFSKFTIIGIIAAILQVFLLWLLIDMMGVRTIIATSSVVIFLFLSKFYLYLLIKLISKKFLKYAAVQIFSMLTNIFLTWFLIDIILMPTVIASTIVVIGLFLMRFILFKVLGIIKN